VQRCVIRHLVQRCLILHLVVMFI